MIALRVYGEPKGQPRVKAFRRGGHAAVYTPGTADGWKLAIVAAWKAWCGGDGPPTSGPLSLSVTFLLPRPKYLERPRSNPARLSCQAKPDLDNLVKAAMDALTMAGVWVDDAQVVSLAARKEYAARGEAPGAELTLSHASEVDHA